MIIAPTGASTAPIPASQPNAAPEPGGPRSVNFPAEGIEQIRREAVRDGGSSPRTWLYAAGAALAGGAALGGVGALVGRSTSVGGTLGGILGAIGGVVASIAGTLVYGKHRIDPGEHQAHVDRVTDFDRVPRPALPATADEPRVDASQLAGKVQDGISGRNVGVVATIDQVIVDTLRHDIRRTVNEKGEPVFSLGSVTGTQEQIEQVIRRQASTFSGIGLGRVLYDPKGYDSLRGAMDAYDGNNAVAVVKDGDKFKVADFDAENWQALRTGTQSLVVTDQRIQAILVNSSVYSPTAVKSDVPGGENGRVFLFAQSQDIDASVPQAITSLDQKSIGWYDTNGSDRERGDTFGAQLNVAAAQLPQSTLPDGTNIPLRFRDRQEAVRAMAQRPGNQAMVETEGLHYVVDLRRSEELERVVRRGDDTGYVHGLRTNENSDRIDLIEDVGGFYAPQGDWWVKVDG